MKKLKCAYCGKPFLMRSCNHIYCCLECRLKAQYKKTQEDRGQYKKALDKKRKYKKIWGENK